MIVQQPVETGELIKKYFYLFFVFGKGSSGNIVLFLLFLIFSVGLFLVVYKKLSQTFLNLATTEKGIAHKEYKQKKMHQRTPVVAFLKKEYLFFKNTPAYILNCAMGSVMMLIFAVFSMVKNKEIYFMLESVAGNGAKIPVFVGLAICFLAATNNISSVSISLEGRNIDFIHSVPCNIRDVFLGKLMLHVSVTVIPLIVSNIIVAIAYKTGVFTAVLMMLMSSVFTFVCAALGLIINLNFPKMEWVNVTVPIKQSLSSFFGMFVGVVLSVLLLGSYFVLSDLLSEWLYLVFMTVILSLISLLLCRWLFTRGTEKFRKL